MLTIFQGMQRTSTADKLTFDKYDKDGDGVISFSEYQNFFQKVHAVQQVQARNTDKKDKGFNLEQFDPQGAINFESNGGFNSKNLNIIA